MLSVIGKTTAFSVMAWVMRKMDKMKGKVNQVRGFIRWFGGSPASDKEEEKKMFWVKADGEW